MGDRWYGLTQGTKRESEDLILITKRQQLIYKLIALDLRSDAA